MHMLSLWAAKSLIQPDILLEVVAVSVNPLLKKIFEHLSHSKLWDIKIEPILVKDE